MKPARRWKFIRKGYKSENGTQKWRVGKWEKIDGELDMCHWGFHCSEKPYQAFTYVQGEILAEVECRGEHLAQEDKECWREQRVIRTYKWTKKDSVALAVYAAELVLPNYEKHYSDKVPREAIEAAKRWLKTGSTKRLRSAESAARSAGSAARSAAWSAESAAWSAARSAESAARSADGARAKLISKISKWFDKRVKELTPLHKGVI